MSVAGLLNFDDQHILGNLLQFIVDFVEQFISLVIEVEAVIYITNPQVAVTVFYHGDYFSGGMSDSWRLRVTKGVNVSPSKEHRPYHVPNQRKPSLPFSEQ